VLAVSHLVSEFDRAFAGHRLMISTTTDTGFALAKERFGAERVFYCPIDLPWAVRRYVKALEPELMVLVETEFWPNLLANCFARGVPVAVINARISDRSYPRYRRFKVFWRPLLERLTVLLAQSAKDAERLKEIGCRPERIEIGGNLKFDVRVAKESKATAVIKELAPRCRFLVAGSTLEGEEAVLLEAWPELIRSNPELVMVIAPRHPERFNLVAERIERSGFKWVRRSAWNGKAAAEREAVRGGEIVLLDTIGELASMYSIASVAFIGGSLAPSGGHNPLEPAQFGVPIIMGPSYENFASIVDDLIEHRAICIARREEFAAALMRLYADETESKAMGERSREVFDRQAGATGRTIAALRGLLKERGA